jgi:hypothetical protein
MKLGLSKLAEVGAEGFTAPEAPQASGSTIICNSDCKYAQNPEKLCSLTHISLIMADGPGVFACNQYDPVISAMQQMPVQNAQVKK